MVGPQGLQIIVEEYGSVMSTAIAPSSLVRETLTIPKPWSLFFGLVDSLKGGVINEHGPFDVFNKLFDETIEKLQEQT